MPQYHDRNQGASHLSDRCEREKVGELLEAICVGQETLGHSVNEGLEALLAFHEVHLSDEALGRKCGHFVEGTLSKFFGQRVVKVLKIPDRIDKADRNGSEGGRLSTSEARPRT